MPRLFQTTSDNDSSSGCPAESIRPLSYSSPLQLLPAACGSTAPHTMILQLLFKKVVFKGNLQVKRSTPCSSGITQNSRGHKPRYTWSQLTMHVVTVHNTRGHNPQYTWSQHNTRGHNPQYTWSQHNTRGHNSIQVVTTHNTCGHSPHYTKYLSSTNFFRWKLSPRKISLSKIKDGTDIC